MSQREVNTLAGRLSLRPPQTESLTKLANAIEAAPAMLMNDRDAAMRASQAPSSGATCSFPMIS